jgi:hypothetical protein
MLFELLPTCVALKDMGIDPMCSDRGVFEKIKKK